MKKLFITFTLIITSVFFHQTFAQGEWAVRGNAFGYFVGELNLQVEHRFQKGFGLNVFGGARPFELSYLSEIEDASKLANRFVGLEGRVYTRKVAGMSPFLMPYIKYSYFTGERTTTNWVDGNPNTQIQTLKDHYVYMGLGLGLREQLAEHFFLEFTFALARGVYGNIRDQNGSRITPNSTRVDARIGVLLGYTFGK